jgi:hypothetical protein
VNNKFFSIHRFIIQEKEVEVYLFCGSLSDYATEAAIVGVPHESVKYVVAGGRYVTRVVGAVPVIVVVGLAVSVPPEMLDDLPAPLDPSSLQVVTKVNTVELVAVAVV